MGFTDQELDLIKKKVKQRKMEAQCGSGGAGAGAGGGGGGSGGEVRRIHIIYFLSRNGRIEHPHLIKVHHLSRNGVRLRDVKRWLSELRGKDMPESFSWSYKRRYKTGYLWQDLLEEDLITPISDNEYVLKGSEIPSLNLYLRSPSEKKAPVQKDGIQEHPKSTMEVPKISSCEIEEESPPLGSEVSTGTDDSVKLEQEKNSRESKGEAPRKSDKIKNFSSLYASLLTKKNPKKTNNNKKSNTINPSTPASSTSSLSSFTKSKSHSSNVLRSLIKCGIMDANDSAMVPINRHDKNSSYVPLKKPDDENISGSENTTKISKGDKLGGSERVFRTSWNQQPKPHPNARKSCDGVRSSSYTKSESSNLKPVSAAYKPINGPKCSQCRKMFKPEEMHKHMKSCRGMKYLAKRTTGASSFETKKSSVESTGQ